VFDIKKGFDDVEYEAQILNIKQMYNRSTKAQLTTKTPLLGRCCYKPFFFTN